ncbi:MAG: hypothetical protein AMJ53_01005 [Gammaproteobacteria bacterium SG8_11]|nr:MAG: hypothetical protein AMJ53_01005 [Gammaproteobacteria bacterium SG8_11]
MAKKRTVSPNGKKHTNSAETASAHTTLVFDGALDIAGAAQLRERLLQVLTSRQPVVIDATSVERVDTAALQVLTAFFKDAGAQNLDVQWKTPAQSLKTAARLLGLQDSLQLS